MLSGAHLNSPGVLLTPPERAAMWLKVAQAYLKAENAASVESSLKAAAEHLRALAPEAEPVLRVQHGVCVAQNLDFMKNFLQAAIRFHDVALQAALFEVRREDVIRLLESATRCVLLAEPGPQRRRVMNLIAGEALIGDVSVRVCVCGQRARRGLAPPPRPPPLYPARASPRTHPLAHTHTYTRSPSTSPCWTR